MSAAGVPAERVLQLRRAPRRLGALARRARLRRRRHGRPLDAARRLVLVARRSLRRVDRPGARRCAVRAYSSGFVGAVVMTFVAYQLARLQSTMPVYAMFLPGFWLLVPGSLGLIGLTTFLAFPDTASGADVFAVIGAIAAVALGVLCGVEVHRWFAGAERRAQAVRRRVRTPGAWPAPYALDALRDGHGRQDDARGEDEQQAEPGSAPIVARASSQFSSAVQPITARCRVPRSRPATTRASDPQQGERGHDEGQPAVIGTLRPVEPHRPVGDPRHEDTDEHDCDRDPAHEPSARSAVVARGVVIMADDATTPPGRRAAAARRSAGLAFAALFVVVYRQVLGITQRPSWPPPADAVTSEGAQAATEAFAARTVPARTMRRCRSPGRPPRRSSRWSRASPSSRGSSRTSKKQRVLPCTSSCSAGVRARSGWRWPRSSGASSTRASR